MKWMAGRMTENLYEYMEADETFEMGAYFTNILEAFAVDGKLAAVPDSFCIGTTVGRAEYYEGIEEWDFTAISSVYNKYREEKILYPGESKSDVFGFLCSGTISDIWTGRDRSVNLKVKNSRRCFLLQINFRSSWFLMRI